MKSPPLSRVRCVLMREQRYLLAQHNSRRPENVGKWGLPGGRLANTEKPKAGLRRELFEELRLHVPYLRKLGNWQHRGETHRVFGCQIDRPVEWFDAGEIVGIGWFSFDEVVELSESGKLHTGFELSAITEFRTRVQEHDAGSLAERPSKRVRGGRKTPATRATREKAPQLPA